MIVKLYTSCSENGAQLKLILEEKRISYTQISDPGKIESKGREVGITLNTDPLLEFDGRVMDYQSAISFLEKYKKR